MLRPISRRDVLKTLSLGATSESLLRVVPLRAAQHVHQVVRAEKGPAASGAYKPKFFTPHQYNTLRVLCQAIIPADEHSGGAIEAGAPEFIDLLTSENEGHQLTLGGGLVWLDSTCKGRYAKVYLECSHAEQKQILDLIAYRATAKKDPSLSQGVHFFSLLRDLTTDAYYTSGAGIKYLQYIGNAHLAEFPGCPHIPE